MRHVNVDPAATAHEQEAEDVRAIFGEDYDAFDPERPSDPFPAANEQEQAALDEWVEAEWIRQHGQPPF